MARLHRDGPESSWLRYAAEDAKSGDEVEGGGGWWGGEEQPYWYCCPQKQKLNGRSCGEMHVRQINETQIATTHESKEVCLVFLDFFMEGRSTAAVLTLDTTVDES